MKNYNDINETFAWEIYRRLSAVQKKQGLTNYKIAKMNNISQSTLTHFKLGHQVPSMQSLSKIAAVLDIDLVDFLK